MGSVLDPEPGSAEAVLAGCLCPVDVNDPVRRPTGLWIIETDCPVHWPQDLPIEEER